jgi:hypothetical protein
MRKLRAAVTRSKHWAAENAGPLALTLAVVGAFKWMW